MRNSTLRRPLARGCRITPPVLRRLKGALTGHMTAGLGSRDVHVNLFGDLSVYRIKPRAEYVVVISLTKLFVVGCAKCFFLLLTQIVL
jgi:hypothetical protein